MAIATAATLGTFTLEWVLHKIFRRRLLTQAQQEDTKHDPEVQASPYNSEGLAARQSTLRAMRVMVMSYTFEIGIIFHSKHPATGRMLVSRTASEMLCCLQVFSLASPWASPVMLTLCVLS